ncbi:MAG: VanZ family protein [candidate division KSB1 bacterium]|nr:VanZ family protein [candidate division KSB1 bacterium]MDZ7340006.1 VanZ family protein [candidate division KSB1 bacterium]
MDLRAYYRDRPYLQPIMSSLIIYVIFVYLLTLSPFQFSLFHLRQFISFKRGYWAAAIGGASVEDVLLNLIMLLPVGVALGMILRSAQFKIWRAVIVAMVFAFAMSGSIEFCQMFLPRSTSLVDVITNTIGAGFGARLAFPIRRFDLLPIINQFYDKSHRFYLRLVSVYGLMAIVLFMLPSYLNTFSNWDMSYHLLLGNEATMNRPWWGSIYRVMVYHRSLKKAEIQSLHATDFNKPLPKRFSRNLLLAIDSPDNAPMVQGILKDQIRFAPHPALAQQEPGTGLVFAGNRLLQSTTPPVVLSNWLARGGQLSIVVWFKPAKIQQVGPARIISLSADTDHRNFMLGQSGAMINFRVRTPLTGENGARVQLLTEPILTADRAQLVVASFNRGDASVYVDGRLISPRTYGTSAYLPLLFGLGNNRYGKIAVCFMVLFPLGWLARGLVNRAKFKSFVSGVVAFLPGLISSLVNVLHFRQGMDWHLLLAGGFISAILMASGIIYESVFGEHRRVRFAEDVDG